MRLAAICTVALMAITMVTPALAATTEIEVGSIKGHATLSKSASGAVGTTEYGSGRAVTATRTVKVTLRCTYGGSVKTYTDTGRAVTNTGNYNSTTASIAVYRPSSSYVVDGASSSHTISTPSESRTKSLQV